MMSYAVFHTDVAMLPKLSSRLFRGQERSEQGSLREPLGRTC